MSDVHIQDVPASRTMSLPAGVSMSPNGQIVVVSLVQQTPTLGSGGITVTSDVTASPTLPQDVQGGEMDSAGSPQSQSAERAGLPLNTVYVDENGVQTSVVTTNNSQLSEETFVFASPSSTTTLGDGDGVKNCLICLDRGSGYHYSAFSCEGCKGFFKRTVQKALAYSCKSDGTCVINKFTRNSCQYCRFQRCLEVGMKREAVREDRSPGGKHRHKRQKFDIPDPACPPSTAKRLKFTDHLLEALVQAKPFLIPKVEGNVSLDSLSINELMHYGYMELRFIIEWAKKVPGFKSLCLDDQMALLKSAFMELNVLRLSYRSVESEGFIKFAEGLTVPIEYATSIGWGKELITATADFTTRLRDIVMDQTEFCMLNAIVLTYPDAAGIQDKQQVTVLQTQMLDALRRYMNHTYPDEHRRYGKMLLRLPALRTVSAKAAERFLSLTLDGNIQLSALVTEMMS